MIYFIYCSKVLSVQSKPQLGNAGLWAQCCPPGPRSPPSPQRRREGWWRTLFVYFVRSDQWGPRLASKLPGSVLPWALESICSDRKRNLYDPAGGLILSVHKHTRARKETYKIQHKLANPSPVGWAHTVCVDGGRTVRGCGVMSAWLLESEQSSPEDPGTPPRGLTRRRDRRGHVMINKQTEWCTQAAWPEWNNEHAHTHTHKQESWPTCAWLWSHSCAHGWVTASVVIQYPRRCLWL